jgi:hypothetical protein
MRRDENPVRDYQDTEITVPCVTAIMALRFRRLTKAPIIKVLFIHQLTHY